MKIRKDVAEEIIRAEAVNLSLDQIDKAWLKKIEKFSQLCADGTSKTHIAFLGTSILAKSVEPTVDLYEIKPKLSKDSDNAYSARSLCHSVLVPLSAELGINLGVTGREPLNNQPYFRMTRLGDDTPVHQGSKEAFNYMLELIDELSKMDSSKTARKALRAFLFVRKKHQITYATNDGVIRVTLSNLPTVIQSFVSIDSEGGKRAQAVVAGMLDVCYGPDRVESGRINDPSRKYPGDVCVRSGSDPSKFDAAFEVRDKPVQISDIHIFGKKCLEMGVLAGAIMMSSKQQAEIDLVTLEDWTSKMGIQIALFHGWHQFVPQALFWAKQYDKKIATAVVERIEVRLKAVEASPNAVADWLKLVR